MTKNIITYIIITIALVITGASLASANKAHTQLAKAREQVQEGSKGHASMVLLEIATEDGTQPGVWIESGKVEKYTAAHGGGDVVYINKRYTELDTDK